MPSIGGSGGDTVDGSSAGERADQASGEGLQGGFGRSSGTSSPAAAPAGLAAVDTAQLGKRGWSGLDSLGRPSTTTGTTDFGQQVAAAQAQAQAQAQNLSQMASPGPEVVDKSTHVSDYAPQEHSFFGGLAELGLPSATGFLGSQLGSMLGSPLGPLGMLVGGYLGKKVGTNFGNELTTGTKGDYVGQDSYQSVADRGASGNQYIPPQPQIGGLNEVVAQAPQNRFDQPFNPAVLDRFL